MYGKSVKSSYLNDYLCRTFRIETELGSGGSGAVYKAWHTRLRKYVVLKITGKNPDVSDEILRNETEALKKIKNLHIPQVLDFIPETNYCFTIMEYITGDSFDKLLKNKQKFSEDRIYKWYIQLASALDAIHKHDIYHRDIKPANIVLTLNDDVCLIDFNSAFVSGNNTGTINRSMGYASPEQYGYFKKCKTTKTGTDVHNFTNNETALHIEDCKTDLSPKINYPEINWMLSDIYSLGATIYHFMTGNRPPVKPHEVSRITAMTGYSEILLKIIERSMRTNPQERFTSAKALQSTLEYFHTVKCK